MLNIYTVEVRAACPVHDGLIDVYQVTIRSRSTIQVEKILGFFVNMENVKIFQEDLAAKAATALGASVEILGQHSGVQVRSFAP